MYNRPQQTFQNRVDLIASNYRKTVAARIARILPAFGFGGIGNKKIRNEAHAYIRRTHTPGQKKAKEPVVVLGRDIHTPADTGTDGRRGGGLFPALVPGGVVPLVTPMGVGGGVGSLSVMRR